MTTIDFLKDVPGFGVTNVVMTPLDSIVLHDVMLAEFFHLSDSLPEMGLPVSTGIYEHRDAILRVMDRLTSRPNQKPGRTTMRIGEQRITAAEVEMIRCTLKKLLNCSEKEMLQRLRVNGSTLNVNVRRERIAKILKHVDGVHGNKIPLINPEDLKGEKGPAVDVVSG
jgi:hypothetical protein